MMRIARRIALSGLASRREAERMITAGRVAVEGKAIESPALSVSLQTAITLDGKPLAQIAAAEMALFHKPRGVLTTHSDPQGRLCLREALPSAVRSWKPIGRLDAQSEGLLLLTTHGAIARYCEHPDNALQRRYRVRLYGLPCARTFASLERGICVEGMLYRPIRVDPCVALDSLPHKPCSFWIEAVLSEGKNRELRKIMAHLGYRVLRLLRTEYGAFSLGDLARGAVARVSESDLRRALPACFLQ